MVNIRIAVRIAKARASATTLESKEPAKTAVGASSVFIKNFAPTAPNVVAAAFVHMGLDAPLVNPAAGFVGAHMKGKKALAKFAVLLTFAPMIILNKVAENVQRNVSMGVSNTPALTAERGTVAYMVGTATVAMNAHRISAKHVDSGSSARKTLTESDFVGLVIHTQTPDASSTEIERKIG